MKLRNGKTINNTHKSNKNAHAIQIQKIIRQFLSKIKYNSIKHSIHILQKYVPHFVQSQSQSKSKSQPQFPPKKVQIHSFSSCTENDECTSTEDSSGEDSSGEDNSGEDNSGEDNSGEEDDDNFIIGQYGKCRNKGKGIQNGVIRSKRRNKGKLISKRYQDPDYQKIFFDKTDLIDGLNLDDYDELSIETDGDEESNENDSILNDFIEDDFNQLQWSSSSSDEFIY